MIHYYINICGFNLANDDSSDHLVYGLVSEDGLLAPCIFVNAKDALEGLRDHLMQKIKSANILYHLANTNYLLDKLEDNGVLQESDIEWFPVKRIQRIIQPLP